MQELFHLKKIEFLAKLLSKLQRGTRSSSAKYKENCKQFFALVWHGLSVGVYLFSILYKNYSALQKYFFNRFFYCNMYLIEV